MESLYARYLAEVCDDNIIETDKGFATYRFLNEGKSIYLIELYVVPEARIGSNYAFDLIDKVVQIGKSNGCTELIGTINPVNKRATEILQANLACGMKVFPDQTGIILRKGI